jgi:hypothetical protein
MLTLVALETLQLRVELSPTVMVSGSAVKELIMGAVGATGFTVMVVVAITLPAVLVAVRV